MIYLLNLLLVLEEEIICNIYIYVTNYFLLHMLIFFTVYEC